MFQVIYAHEWMNDAHDYEMQVQSGKTNTRGVTGPCLVPQSLHLQNAKSEDSPSHHHHIKSLDTYMEY